MLKYSFLLLPLLGLAFASPQPPAAPAPAPKPPSEFEKTVVPFLKANCLACHAKGSASAGLELEGFLKEESLAKDPDSWKHFVGRIRTGQMPPAEMPRPDANQSKVVTSWILGKIARQEKEIKAQAGKVTARRLNRAEYNNTIRDLLGVSLRPADDFPQDDSGYGFDNIGDALSLSPPLLEKYLTAAERVSRTAIFGAEKVPAKLVELRSSRKDAPRLEKIPTEYDKSGLTLLQAFHTTYKFPTTAKYLFNPVLSGLRPPGCEPMHLALWIDGKKVQEIEHQPSGTPSFSGSPLEIYGQKAAFAKQTVTAGDHWVAITIENIYEGLPASFGGPNPSKQIVPPATGNRFPPLPADATPEQIARRKDFEKRNEERIANQIYELPNATKVGNLELGGPYEQVLTPDPQVRAKIFTCGHTGTNAAHTAACPKTIIANFARRAFRRTVTEAEIAPYLSLFAQSRKQGDSFDEAICAVTQAILVSPHFLYRIDQKGDAFELASRLSYFIWSTTPDETLLKLAENGTLRTPAVLEAQLTRMLQDPRSSTLAENFAGQWLELRKLESLKPDLDKFPTFDEYLRFSMKRETELFFTEILKKDRPILDFIDGNYTFVNERLANHYGMVGITGPEFRKVSLAGTNRCGVATQASVLTLTSYSTRTSPVLRGKWVLDNLLNTPPPPPPPGIPSLEETKVPAGASLRQQLEAHRQKPLCASCHAKLDPLGFGLENFDAIGKWRTMDGKTAVEASGTLPGGKSFVGATQMASVLKTDKDTFTRALTAKLLTYALGRGLERYDQPTVKKIAEAVAKDNYKFSALTREIVLSLPFQQNNKTGVMAKK